MANRRTKFLEKMFVKLFLIVFVSFLPLQNCLYHVNHENEIFGDIFHIDADDDYPESIEVPTTRILSKVPYIDGPPPGTEHARMSRYIAHQSVWCAVATISTRSPTEGSPFSNVLSVSDGSSVDDASGIPYFYLSSMEMSVQDFKANNNASITMSLAQSDYCTKSQYDFQDPRCSHVILTGKINQVVDNSEEETFAQNALFKRHPVMASWPKNHGYRFYKMDISNVVVLDIFGGPNTVTVDDYFKATPY